MLNIHLSYKPPSSWRIMFCPWGYPRQFSRLNAFRDVVVHSGGCCKGIIIQVILTPMVFIANVQS